MMDKIYQFFKYVGYFTFSILLGWLSTIGGEEEDYVSKVGVTFIPVLLTLIALTTTLTGLFLNELYKLKSKFKLDINSVVDNLKRNVIIQIGIVSFAFIFFSCKVALIICFPFLNLYAAVIQNSVVVFSFMYFVLVIADTALGLYNLIKKNNE